MSKPNCKYTYKRDLQEISLLPTDISILATLMTEHITTGIAKHELRYQFLLKIKQQRINFESILVGDINDDDLQSRIGFLIEENLIQEINDGRTPPKLYIDPCFAAVFITFFDQFPYMFRNFEIFLASESTVDQILWYSVYRQNHSLDRVDIDHWGKEPSHNYAKLWDLVERENPTTLETDATQMDLETGRDISKEVKASILKMSEDTSFTVEKSV